MLEYINEWTYQGHLGDVERSFHLVKDEIKNVIVYEVNTVGEPAQRDEYFPTKKIVDDA